MARQFTIRISEEESDKLLKIKKITGETTDNATIRFMINHYEELDKRYNQEKRKNNDLVHKYEELSLRVKRFVTLFKDLGKDL